MRVLGFGSENMASTHLRTRCWINALKKRGHDAQFLGDPLEHIREIDTHFTGADAVLYGRTHDARKVAVLQAGRKVHGYKLIVDTDDLITRIPSYNFAIKAFHNATGIVRIGEAQYRDSDAFTVSTPTLLEMSDGYNGNTVCVPNTVDLELYRDVRVRMKEPRHRGDIRIYWGGGGGHYDDLLIVKEPLIRLFHEDTRIKLIFSNFVPDWAALLPPQRVFFMRLIEFREFPKLLRWICPDIGIAPLVENDHNRCKSHVKWLDYSMAGAAGVYQDIEAYETVADGVTGLKAKTQDDWYKALRSLVGSAELRLRLANAAKFEILAKWTTETWADRFEAFLKEVVSRPEARPAMPLAEGVPIEATPCLTPSS